MSRHRQAVRLRDREGSPKPHLIHPHLYMPYPRPPLLSVIRGDIKCRYPNCGQYEDSPLHIEVVRNGQGQRNAYPTGEGAI